MSKTNNIIDFIEAGLRAEQLRQKAIASNIANLQTPQYRTVNVRFEQLLSKAINSQGQVDFDKLQPQLYHPENTKIKANGNDVSLENEIGKMVQNSLKHDTYVKLLRKKYKQIEMAIDVK